MNIFLRNLSLNDANDFFYAAWDEKVFHFLPGFYCDSLKQAKDTIKSLLSTKNVTAHVIASEENPFIGVIVAVKKETQEEKEAFEISYFINEKFRKKGYATEGIQQILKKYENCKLYLNIVSWNYASIALAKKFTTKTRDGEYENIYIIEN
ncbi:MAG: GNAT family N-acetyltransferase [Clostridia bacterium]|nr:GNAT family N-acetyltransferase [Clostridia bacterium]